jgi:hypothetical protein
VHTKGDGEEPNIFAYSGLVSVGYIGGYTMPVKLKDESRDLQEADRLLPDWTLRLRLGLGVEDSTAFVPTRKRVGIG